jgi:hypothetical protein
MRKRAARAHACDSLQQRTREQRQFELPISCRRSPSLVNLVHGITEIGSVLSARDGRAAALQMLAMPMGIAVRCALHRIPSRVSLTAHSNDSADQPTPEMLRQTLLHPSVSTQSMLDFWRPRRRVALPVECAPVCRFTGEWSVGLGSIARVQPARWNDRDASAAIVRELPLIAPFVVLRCGSQLSASTPDGHFSRPLTAAPPAPSSSTTASPSAPSASCSQPP